MKKISINLGYKKYNVSDALWLCGFSRHSDMVSPIRFFRAIIYQVSNPDRMHISMTNCIESIEHRFYEKYTMINKHGGLFGSFSSIFKEPLVRLKNEDLAFSASQLRHERVGTMTLNLDAVDSLLYYMIKRMIKEGNIRKPTKPIKYRFRLPDIDISKKFDYYSFRNSLNNP